MAKTKIFVSSTFYDLKHVRSSLEDFIKELGYEPILSEKGNISYDPKAPLDISCYREAQIADIFVLIIGGRYGSEISEERGKVAKEFYDKYESVTKKEFESAYEKEIPIYILIEKSVFSEYETFRRNKSNDSIEYAHVDSVNIFHFIEEVFSKPKNNAIYQFERHSEIKDWLKEQWSGLFRELLHQRTEQQQYNSLTERIEELSSINNSLKSYMEKIITDSSADAEEIISKENERQKEEKNIRELEKFTLFSTLIEEGVDEKVAVNYFKNAETINDLARVITENVNLNTTCESLIIYWKDKPEIVDKINKIRKVLDKEEINFESID